MRHQPPSPDRFREVFELAHADVLRFAQRRTSPEHAEDVAAETFLTAWRRLDDLPQGDDDARAWLFGIARNQLLNEQRGRRRRDALAVRVLDSGWVDRVPDGSPGVDARLDLAAAWRRLASSDQEVLSLTVFEGLTSEAAGAVLGITATAYRARLSRARASLRHHLDQPTPHLQEIR